MRTSLTPTGLTQTPQSTQKGDIATRRAIFKPQNLQTMGFKATARKYVWTSDNFTINIAAANDVVQDGTGGFVPVITKYAGQ